MPCFAKWHLACKGEKAPVHNQAVDGVPRLRRFLWPAMCVIFNPSGNPMIPTTLSAPERSFECIEIYVPKNLEHLSELYNYLRRKLSERKAGVQHGVLIEGFSLYEVDGALYGSQIYQERTVVIRILVERTDSENERSILRKVQALGAEIATTVALAEEELWICHYPQRIVIIQTRPGEQHMQNHEPQ